MSKKRKALAITVGILLVGVPAFVMFLAAFQLFLMVLKDASPVAYVIFGIVFFVGTITYVGREIYKGLVE